MTYLFLDTMIYLHYTWFEDIDWPDVVGDQSVQIVVPHITLQELDNHKDNHKSAKIRDRARKVANKFLECFLHQGGTLKGSLSACEMDESASFDFDSHNLDKSKNDHRLLAAILEFKKSRSDSVCLVTQDVGPRLKANRLGIQATALPETHRLPSEEDPIVKENKQLKNELLKIQAAMPRLSLGIDELEGKDALTIFRTTALDVDAEMKKVRDKFPLMENRPPNAGNLSKNPLFQNDLRGLAGISQIPESEYARYNRDCEKYFKQCEVYFAQLQRHQLKCRVELDLYVSNDGGAPAEDVDISIHFPDGFELYTMDDLPKEPEAPVPPQKPRTVLQMSLGSGRIFDAKLVPPQYFSEIRRMDPRDRFSLTKTNSYKVEDAFPRIKHGQAGIIRPLMILFDSYESASSFQITYRISAANLPEPVKGALNVVIKKGASE